MIGDKCKQIAANSSKTVRITRTKPISLFAENIHELEALTRQPGAYFTNFEYTIRYTTDEILNVIKHGKAFLVKVDLFDTVEKCGHRVADFNDLCNSEKFKEFIPFLLRYTFISEELFSIAKSNPNIDIPVSFNVKKYVDDVKRNYKEKTGSELEEFTFWSKDYIQSISTIKEDKTISRDNTQKQKLKGVVE